MRKRIICLFGLVLLLCGCSAAKPKNPELKNPADMSGYVTYDPETEYLYEASTAEEFIERYDNKETFVAYFGFTDCPFCTQAMPVLNEIAAENHTAVDYIDVRADSAWKSNKDINCYDEIVDRIGYLFEQEDGGPHLYVPFVVFIKDGEAVQDHVGVTDDYTPGTEITEEQKAVLSDIYRSGFEALSQ